MDPNANLMEQNTLLDASSNLDKQRRSELRRALDWWLAQGGFQPDWKAYPVASKEFRKWQRNMAKFSDLVR
jgi:hypothetical protein